MNLLRQASQAAVRFFYPSRCGLCGTFGPEAICEECRAELQPLGHVPELDERNPITALTGCFHYEGRAGQAVRRLKFERVTSLGRPMAELMAQRLNPALLAQVDAIIPLPIHWRRENHRGFNQSVLLCEAWSRELVQADLLRRIRHTVPQTHLKAEQRATNILGAFEASPDVRGKRLLLVDDVYTTGSTAKECAKCLRQAGAFEVFVHVFTLGGD